MWTAEVVGHPTLAITLQSIPHTLRRPRPSYLSDTALPGLTTPLIDLWGLDSVPPSLAFNGLPWCRGCGLLQGAWPVEATLICL